MQIPMTVNEAGLPVTIGVPIKKTENILNTSQLVIKRAGVVVPAGFRILSRWESVPNDPTKPAKFILCDFQPTATGAHTLEDSGGNQAPASAIAITDNVGDFQVATAGLNFRVAKSGNDILTSFQISAVEQLAAGAKPRILAKGPADIAATIVRLDTGALGNGPDANAGATTLRLDNVSAFQVGDQFQTFYEGKFSYYLNDAIIMQPGFDYGTWYQNTTNPLRHFILARGTARELLITQYQYPYGGALFRILPYGSDGYSGLLSQMQAGDLMEDWHAAAMSVKTITAIDAASKIITFTSAKAMMTTNVNIANPGTAIFDGRTLAPGDRLYLAGQTIGAENAVYIFNGASSPLSSPVAPNTLGLEYETIQGGKIRKLVAGGGSGQQEFTAKVLSATIEETNPMRVVVKQNLEFNLSGGLNPYPKLYLCARYYVYAGQNRVRVRYHMRNAELTDPAQFSLDAQFEQLSIQFPLATAPTASDDLITLLTGAGSAGERIAAAGLNATFSVAAAGSFKLAVGDFAENFPSRLHATGTQIEYFPFPAIPGFAHTFFANWEKTWEFCIGENADALLPVISKSLVTLDAQYSCDSKAIRHALTPVKGWTAADFGGNALQAEAANRGERLLSIGYDVTAADPPGLPGGSNNPRMSLYEWRNSEQLYPGGSNHFGQMYGWQYFGNTRDGDSDGYTFNRYDIPFIMLREWVRGGSPKAWRLGVEHGKYMAGSGGGTWPGATGHNGSSIYLYKGLSRYERSPLLTTGTQSPRPTHSWGEGVWLYAMLTGDPIALETAHNRRERVRTWNYNGIFANNPDIVDLSMAFGEIRGPGWAALEELAAWRYGGDITDLNRCKQYLDNLRLSEESQGSKGNMELTPNGDQVVFMYGYISVAVCEYIREMRFQGTPDAAQEAFLLRMAKFLLTGDATLTLPGNNKPLIGGNLITPSSYQPIGLPYFWRRNGNTQAETPVVAYVDLVAVLLVNAADIFLRADFRQKADTIFRDVCFHRDNGDGPRDPAERTEINYRNNFFFGSSGKVYGQTGLAIADYLPTAAANASLNPPVLDSVLPLTVNQGLNHTITLTGSGFTAGAQAVVDDQLITPASITATQIVFELPASLIAGASSKAIAVLNANGGISGALSLTIQPAFAPVFTSITPAAAGQNAADTSVAIDGNYFQSGAKLVWQGLTEINTSFVSSTSLTATIPAALLEDVGTYQVSIKNPDNQTSQNLSFQVENNVPSLASVSPNNVSVGSGLQQLFASGTNFAPGATATWDGSISLAIAVTNNTTALIQVPANLLTAPGTHQIRISNPTPGGGTSNPVDFVISGAGSSAPIAGGLSPSTRPAGSGQFVLTVNGSNFVSGAAVRWNGANLVTTFVSASQLTAVVPAGNVAAEGTATISVQNPDSQVSNNLNFSITAGGSTAPAIAGLSPASANAGASQFTLTVNGSGFVSGSLVRWAAGNLVTVFVSASQLTATVPASLLVSAGVYGVSVLNPDSQASNTVNFTVGAISGGGSGVVHDLSSATDRPSRELIEVKQGDSFDKAYLMMQGGVPVDLTGYSFLLQVRNNTADSGAPVLVTMAMGQGITVEAGTGIVRLSMIPTETAKLKFYRAIYELQMTDPNGKQKTIREGEFRVRPEVAR
jgi:hypothetical protein